MRRFLKYFLITSLISSVGAAGLKQNFTSLSNADSDQRGNTALNAEIPNEEIADKGVLMYLAGEISNQIEEKSNYTVWEENFINTKNCLGESELLLIDYKGDAQILDMSDKATSTQLNTRYEGLGPITVKTKITQEELFEYIRDYKARGYFALQDFEENLQKINESKYALRLDYIFVKGDNIVVYAFYDNGAETDIAVRLVDGISIAESVMYSWWNEPLVKETDN